jgi:sulfate permease, SulP family
VRIDRRELAGAVADLGVLVPIAVALIVGNGLSPTAVLLPAGALYVAAAFLYRLPMPVQPLKAFGAIAITQGLGTDEVATGALLMGAIFILLGSSGLIDLAARVFPRAVIRGVQLAVGLLFLKIAWGLVTEPPAAFVAGGADLWLALGVVALALVFRRRLVTLALVGIGIAVMVARAAGDASLGPSGLALPSLDSATVWTAFTVLVIPQLPLSFANSCLATADAARVYFGERAERVRPGRLATSFGAANVFAGAIGGMPVCHGAGGLTAHVTFGARTGGAPLAMGGALLALAVAAGSSLAVLLAAFPLPVLAGMLATAGLLHIGLLRDLAGMRAWTTAIAVGVLGVAVNLALAVGLGLAAWWLVEKGVVVRVRRRAAAEEAQRAPV